MRQTVGSCLGPGRVTFAHVPHACAGFLRVHWSPLVSKDVRGRDRCVCPPRLSECGGGPCHGGLLSGGVRLAPGLPGVFLIAVCYAVGYTECESRSAEVAETQGERLGTSFTQPGFSSCSAIPSGCAVWCFANRHTEGTVG